MPSTSILYLWRHTCENKRALLGAESLQTAYTRLGVTVRMPMSFSVEGLTSTIETSNVSMRSENVAVTVRLFDLTSPAIRSADVSVTVGGSPSSVQHS